MDERYFDSINVIPFVDIMLVLLTIVLTTSSFIASGRIPVNLPRASASREPATAAQVIELGRLGDIHFQGKSFSPDTLKPALLALPRDSSFVVRADRDVSLQHFVDVVDVLKELHFAKVAVQTVVHG
jgi:biopolymer transport protein ExbD